MDKIQIKKEIESLKKKLIDEKDKWKKKNEQFKTAIEGLARQAASNAARKDKIGKDAATRIKKEIASRKHSWQCNEKRFEKEAYERIKGEIERLKGKLS
jgi:hypothetical protein